MLVRDVYVYISVEQTLGDLTSLLVAQGALRIICCCVLGRFVDFV